MELKDVKLNHLKNLTVVNCDGVDLSVAVVDRGVEFSERNNIYISFSADKVEKRDTTENLAVESFSKIKYIKEYPAGTKIGDLDKVKPIKNSYFETYMDFCGVVTDVQKVPAGAIDKYTKNICLGHFVTIKTSELTFVLNLVTRSDIADAFFCITGNKKEAPSAYIPSVGHCVKGRAQVIGVLF